MDEVELEDSGRGLICKDPINMGNALFQLPLKIVIDKEKALEVRWEGRLGFITYIAPILSPLIPPSIHANPTGVQGRAAGGRERVLRRGAHAHPAEVTGRAVLLVRVCACICVYSAQNKTMYACTLAS
jgi:hypothetical protein